MIHTDRIQELNERPNREGDYVLYWMQASQREEYNHALEFAVRQANEQEKPLVAVFGITDAFPEANLRHYAFMLEGLREVQEALAERGVPFVVRYGPPDEVALDLARDASLLVTDRGYLRVQKDWRRTVAEQAECSVIQVESDIVVPVEVVSEKEEYSAATIRPKIQRNLKEYLTPVRRTRLKHGSVRIRFDGLDLSDVDSVLDTLNMDRSVSPQSDYPGGTSTAKPFLKEFIQHKLEEYAERRNDPSLGIQSHMSPYLHFGQISPVYIALQIQKESKRCKEAVDAYLEELIVRRELAINFVQYNPRYDSFESLHEWSKETLKKHEKDKRDTIYSLKELERASTHDPYWNAAMLEMLITGKMANYMRMYWAKKILEWSRTPREGFKHTLYLNNKYFLDGRDPNSFAGVAWCFGKHDRPWTERPVFGKIRYMNDSGLRRKFDIDAYVKKIERIAGERDYT